jgi:hypothetical protein
MTYKPGDQPDPEFAAFFAGDWQRILENVVVPGIDNPSWDRKAAYMLWVAMCELPTGGNLEVELGLAEPPRLDFKLLARDVSQRFPIVMGVLHAAETVGVNPDDDLDCEPTPGGVRLVFDSSKW